MDAIYLIDTDCSTQHEISQTIMVIGPITGSTIHTLISHLRRALAGEPHGPARDLVLDLSCCTNLTIDGALGLDSADRELRHRGGNLLLTRVPPLIEYVLRQHNRHHLIRSSRALTRGGRNSYSARPTVQVRPSAWGHLGLTHSDSPLTAAAIRAGEGLTVRNPSALIG